MAIKSIKDKSSLPIEIDLTGPDGNAFVLMSYARHISKVLGIDHMPIIEEMMKGDYEDLLAVFESHFGDYVTLYR